MAELDKAKKFTDKDWDLDEGLLEVLDAINANPNLQTILSKRSENLLRDNVSYLHFTYTKESFKAIMETLGEIIDVLKENYISGNLEYLTASQYKRKTPNELRNKYRLDVISNLEKYTNINCFIIEIFSFNAKDHELFWNLLKNKLKDLEIRK